MYTNTMAVVLAAGKGTRLQSEQYSLPKVMRLAAERPLLAWVLEALRFLPEENVVIVAGYMKEKVMEAFPGRPFAVQEPQLGTGHAVMCAKHALAGFSGTVLVCYGDMPLLTAADYRGLLAEHEKSGADCTLLSGTSTLDLPYGRIVRDAAGGFERVVEDRDCTPEQKQIRELNVGIYAFAAPQLLRALEGLQDNNAQHEYYLTDVPEIIQKNGGKVVIYTVELNEKIIGVNTAEQLETVEKYLKAR